MIRLTGEVYRDYEQLGRRKERGKLQFPTNLGVLSIKEFAALVGVSVPTIGYWLKRGQVEEKLADPLFGMHGNEEWQKLSDTPRDHLLRNIK